MRNPDNKRRFSNLIISRKIQLKYSAIGILILLVYSIFLLGIAFSPQIKETYNIYTKDETLTAHELDQLKNFKLQIIDIGILFIISFCVCFLVIVLFTHRFLGPLYRVNEKIYKLMDKNLTVRISLREDDELKDMAEDINKFIDEFEKLIMTLRLRQEEISMILFKARDQAFQQSTKDILNKISKHNEKIIEELLRYKVLGDR